MVESHVRVGGSGTTHLYRPPEGAVSNRRTLCDHCSLRTDLPGFIGAEHAQSNVDQIASGQLFQCHMIADPGQENPEHRTCLGAALVAKAPLGTPPRPHQPPVYASLAGYRQAQVEGRRTNIWLEAHADKWYDRYDTLWYGWWAHALAGNWRYLMTTLRANDSESVYLFFDQAQELFGPLYFTKET